MSLSQRESARWPYSVGHGQPTPPSHTPEVSSGKSAIPNGDLRKLKRADLLEILVEQGRELERLRHELALAQAELEDRRIRIDNCGSIAEAALQLNGVFEAAQAAADQYLASVKMAGSRTVPEGMPVREDPRPIGRHMAMPNGQASGLSGGNVAQPHSLAPERLADSAVHRR